MKAKINPLTSLEQPLPLKTPQISYPITNFQKLVIFEQEYAQRAGAYQPPRLGTKHHLYPNAILVEEGTPSPMGGGILSFSRKYCQMPGEIYKEPVQVSYTFPGAKVRTAYKLEWEEVELSNTANGEGTGEFIWAPKYKKVNNMVVREPTTKSVIGRKEIEFIDLSSVQFAAPSGASTTSSLRVNQPVEYNGQMYYLQGTDPPTIWVGGQLIDLSQLDSGQTFQPLRSPSNGFNFGQVQITQGFQPTAKPMIYDEDGNISAVFTGQNPRGYEPTDYVYDINSEPTIQGYDEMVNDEVEIQTETTMLEQFMGTIYQKTSIFIKAQT